MSRENFLVCDRCGASMRSNPEVNDTTEWRAVTACSLMPRSFASIFGGASRSDEDEASRRPKDLGWDICPSCVPLLDEWFVSRVRSEAAS